MPRNSKFSNQNNEIPDDLDFLKNLTKISKKDPSNTPGPYWDRTARHAVREIQKKGLGSFRDFGSNVGESYADAPIVDIRPSLQGLIKSLARFLVSQVFPINRVFDNQVNLTKSIYKILLEKESTHIQNDSRVQLALSRLNLPEVTTRGNCVAATNLNNMLVSNLYLECLTLIDKIEDNLGYKDVKSFMEIGAGFGVNIHLLIENFPNIRKFLLVDISPTLYVSTQYLRSFYNETVIDAVQYEQNKNLQFKENSDLEIICILPSQLKTFHGAIDFFYNSHSFVEMTKEIVSRFAVEIHRLQLNSKVKKVALCTYQTAGNKKTVSYRDLPQLLGLSMREISDTWPRDGYNLNTFFFSSGKTS